METGFSPAPRIVVFNSGIPELATLNSCCKATRTPSFPSHPAHLVDRSQPDPAICVPESGATSLSTAHTAIFKTKQEGESSDFWSMADWLELVLAVLASFEEWRDHFLLV
jgi:hypothetical protein